MKRLSPDHVLALIIILASATAGGAVLWEVGGGLLAFAASLLVQERWQ